MKAILTLIGFFISTSLFPQKIDLVNAPKNPIAYKYKLEHFDLRGPVYASGNKLFSKDGLLIYDNVFVGQHYFYDKNGRLTHTSQGNEFKYGSNGYIDSYTYPSFGIKSTKYEYNNRGLLIAEKYDATSKTYSYEYTYDSQDRLIKKSNNATNYTSYTYEKKGDILIVKENDVREGVSKLTTYTYEKGIITAYNDVLMSKYNKKDAYGNWTRDYDPVIFYSDLKTNGNQFSMEFIKRDYSIEKLRDCKFFLNGKQTDAVYKRLLNKNEVIIYNPFEEQYYIIKNAIDDAKSGQKQVFTDVYLNTPSYLEITESSSYKLIHKGAEYINNLYLRSGSLKVNTNKNNYLVYDKFADKTFFTKYFPDNKFTFYGIKEVEGTNIIYIKDDVEGRFLTLDHGKPLDASKYTIGYNGNDAILYNGQTPEYYLPLMKTAPIGDVYPGRKFNPSTDKLANTKESISKESTSNNSYSSNSVSSNSYCTSGNCTDGYGKLKLSNGTTQEGFFTNGKLNGYGVETYVNTDNYSGNFVNNVKSGYGIFYWKNSNTQYYGQWENDKINGYGYLVKDGKTTAAGIYTNGNLTKDLLVAFKAEKLSNGNCLGNCVDGYGTKTYDNGDGYTGIFYNGKPYKAGNYRWNSSKSSFVGDFDANGKLTNYGMYIADSYVYVGEITLGKLTGKAIKVDKQTGKQIQGEFKDGVLVVDYSNPNIAINNPTQTNTPISNSRCLSGNCTDGYGTYKYDNSTIEGFFKGGKANGYGNQTYDKSSYSGNFKDENRNGFGVYYWTDTKQYYIGEWKAGKQHGYGYYRTNDVITHAGYYENGSQVTNMIDAYKNNATIGGCKGNCVDGFGELSYSDGAMVTGFFKNSKINGPALIIWANKDVYIGNWIDNVRIGHGTYLYKSLNNNYYGDFSNNKFNGLGVYFDKDKKIISKGYWVDGKVQTNM